MTARTSTAAFPRPARARLRRAATALFVVAGAGLLMLVSSSKVLAADAGDSPARPASRAEAVAIIAEARRIVTPNAVERLEKVRIGAIEQWISVRGHDRDNPVLLVFHGGPGYVSMPLGWWNMRGVEEFFTVVQWDQRAAGKTHLLTAPDAVQPTLTLDRMYGDAEEVAAWTRRELGKDKLFVLGHSWGTYLGLRLATERPAWLHAYVGVAQITDMRENERRNWQSILGAARRAGNAEAVAALEALAPYAAPGVPVPMEHVYTQRRWGQRLGGTLAYRDDNRAESALTRLAPEYDDEDSRRIWDGNAFATPHLFREIIDIDFTAQRRYAVPLLMFLGRHDTVAHPGTVSAWLDGVEAPLKRTVWFEHSAHSPMTEEPGRYLLALVEHLRPIAERAGDVPAAP